jgi:hypothetical protein
MTSLTGALDQLDRCMPFVGFSSCEHLGEFPIVVCFCWSVHGRFRGVWLGFVYGFLPLQVVFFDVVLIQGLEESLRLPETFFVRLL